MIRLNFILNIIKHKKIKIKNLNQIPFIFLLSIIILQGKKKETSLACMCECIK